MSDKKTVEQLSTFIIVMATIPVAAIAGGYVAMKYWNWFMVNGFEMSPWTMTHGLCAWFVLCVVRVYGTQTKSDSSFDLGDFLIMLVIKPLLMLFIGFIGNAILF